MIIPVSKVIISRNYVTLVTVDQAAYVLFTHEWFKNLTPGIEPGTSGTECSVESHELRINSCKRCDLTNVTNVHSSVQKKGYNHSTAGGSEPRILRTESCNSYRELQIV
ncbi:unnamed protein product [Clavelina lepadiformis]|uniref:Uncharacterized protein n=1 Tax=Clavelina lepadiformis TaxID=159417 RepID=A0ABP0FHD3_CLALP